MTAEPREIVVQGSVSRAGAPGASTTPGQPASSAPDEAPGLTNPPGQASLVYRLGTYQTFLAAMLKRLPTQPVPNPGAGPPLRPLASLTTRDPGDLTIALLDAWAMVSDVITFYQERNANEGYLRTARERRSVLDLAGEIGYAFRPGVAASAPLAFTLSATAAPNGTTIPAGTQVQSAPSGGKSAQIFETSQPIRAFPAWNALTPALTQTQVVAAGATGLDLAGTATRLRPGQPILLCDGDRPVDFRLLQTVRADAAQNVTHVTWQRGLSADYADPQVLAFRGQASLFGYNAPDWSTLPDAIKARFGDDVPTPITSVAFSSDGDTVVSGQENGSLTIWSIANGLTPVVTVPNAHTSTLCVAFTPDGAQVASGGADGLVKLWDTQGTLQDTLSGHTGAVNGVAFSPDYAQDSHLASASADHTVRLWTVGTSSVPVTFAGHTQAVNAVAFSPDAQQLLSGGDDRAAIRWSLQGTVLQTCGPAQGLQGAVKAVAFSPEYGRDGLFVTGGADTLVLWWQNTAASPVRTYAGHTSIVTGLSFSPAYATDNRLLSCSLDRTVIAWLPNSHTVLREHVMAVNGVASPPVGNGQWAVSGSADTTLVLWNVGGGQAVRVGSQPSRYDQWPGFEIAPDAVDLSAVDPAVVPGGRLALWTGDGSNAVVCSVAAVETAARSDFLLTAQVTRITPDVTLDPTAFPVRTTIVSLQGEPLPLAAAPLSPAIPPCPTPQDRRPPAPHAEHAPRIQSGSPSPACRGGGRGVGGHPWHIQSGSPSPACGGGGCRGYGVAEGPRIGGRGVGGDVIPLAQRVAGLETGQLLALSGERYDCHTRQGTGERVSEVVTLLGVSATSGDTATVLHLTAPPRYHYVRATLTVNANVAQATNGQSVANEVLGSGDATRRNQRFTLKRSPLTYVPDATATGSRSTLRVYVDGIEWCEVPGFYGQGGHDRVYTARTDADGQTSVRFGDGIHGARLPSGQENVTATYRVGIGPSGEVGAGTLNQLTSSVPGVSGVTNPEAATGAAGPDTRDSARARAPLTVATLGRIVSLQDYDDVAQAFAGVGQAKTRLLWNGSGQVVHITILGEDARPISEESLLYRGLIEAIDAIRAPAQPVVVQSGADLIRQFVVAARIVAGPGFRAAPVRAAAELALRQRFSFATSAFGRGVAASDVMTVIQNTPGVQAVDLTVFAFADRPPTLEPYLAPRTARWDAQAGAFVPDQILAIDASGIQLTVEGGS